MLQVPYRYRGWREILAVVLSIPLLAIALVFWRASHAREEAAAEVRSQLQLPFRIVPVERAALLLSTRDDLLAQSLELLAGGGNPTIANDRWYREAAAAAAPNTGELRGAHGRRRKAVDHVSTRRRMGGFHRGAARHRTPRRPGNAPVRRSRTAAVPQ